MTISSATLGYDVGSRASSADPMTSTAMGTRYGRVRVSSAVNAMQRGVLGRISWGATSGTNPGAPHQEIPVNRRVAPSIRVHPLPGLPDAPGCAWLRQATMDRFATLSRERPTDRAARRAPARKRREPLGHQRCDTDAPAHEPEGGRRPEQHLAKRGSCVPEICALLEDAHERERSRGTMGGVGRRRRLSKIRVTGRSRTRTRRPRGFSGYSTAPRTGVR